MTTITIENGGMFSRTNFADLADLQEKKLDRRYEYVLKHPDEGKTWEEIEKVL